MEKCTEGHFTELRTEYRTGVVTEVNSTFPYKILMEHHGSSWNITESITESITEI